MKLKIYILVLSILLSANISTYAQNSMKILKYYTKADSLTIDPNSFFPMQVGNFWQYAFQNEIVREERVIKDSSLNKNLKLIWLSLDGHDSSSLIFALDTNYNVYDWQPALELDNMQHPFKLNADIGEEWIYAKNEYDPNDSIIRKVESIF